MNAENPPQMTWKSLLRQRFYDLLNVRHPSEQTQREEEIMELAINEVEGHFAEKSSPQEEPLLDN